jgi:hypothetical protein
MVMIVSEDLVCGDGGDTSWIVPLDLNTFRRAATNGTYRH